MPYTILHPSPNVWRVINAATKRVHAEHTTKKKAEAQVRLLLAVEHGWKPSNKRK